MFEHEYEAWNYLAKVWRDIKFIKDCDGVIIVRNNKYDSFGICWCIGELHYRDNLITYDMYLSMRNKIDALLSSKKQRDYLFPCDQKGAELRRQLCLELAFQNIVEQYNGKVKISN